MNENVQSEGSVWSDKGCSGQGWRHSTQPSTTQGPRHRRSANTSWSLSPHLHPDTPYSAHSCPSVRWDMLAYFWIVDQKKSVHFPKKASYFLKNKTKLNFLTLEIRTGKILLSITVQIRRIQSRRVSGNWVDGVYGHMEIEWHNELGERSAREVPTRMPLTGPRSYRARVPATSGHLIFKLCVWVNSLFQKLHLRRI